MGVSIKKKVKKNVDVTSTSVAIPSGDGVTLIKTAIGKVLVKGPKGEESEAQEAGVVAGLGPFANVGVRASRTINMGDYNSVKIEVSLNVPCGVNQKEMDESFDFAAQWVDEKMQALSEEYS